MIDGFEEPEQEYWRRLLNRLRKERPIIEGHCQHLEEKKAHGIAKPNDYTLLLLCRRARALLDDPSLGNDPIALLALREAVTILREPTESVIKHSSASTTEFESLQLQIQAATLALVRVDLCNHFKLVETIRSELEQVRTLVAKANEAHRILEQAAQSAVTKAKGREFVGVAEGYERSATKWLWCAITFLSLLSSGAAASLIWAEDVPFSLAHWVPRIILTSLATYGIFVSIRNYRALSHTAIVTRHRGSALLTLEELRPLADSQTASGLLNHAAAAMFAAQPTGFSPTSEAEEKQLVDLVRAIRGKD